MSSEKYPPFLSVVMACYNEEQNLKRGVLDEVYQYLHAQPYTWEVIIVNDESTDESKNLIAQFIQDKQHFFLFDIPHGGKPAGIWTGIQKARGELVLFTDVDQSTPLAEISKLLPWYEKGFDVIIGSRGNAREGFSVLRKSGSFMFRTLRRSVLLRTINDTQCGFKSCRRQAALDIFPHLQIFKQMKKPTGWKVSAYDVELLYLFERAGYRIKEVPVTWYNLDQSETKDQTGPFTRYFHESIEMASEVLRVKLNQLRGEYNEIQPRIGSVKELEML
jgi:glycosyltransferase involved in cell wall biosynthesis